MGRILSIDYGTKRTGIAVSDPLRIIAGGLETVPTHTLLEWLKKYIPANGVDIIVVGRPVQMNGEPSQTMPHIEGLVRRLRSEFPQVEVDWHDERFTSVMAQRAMIEGGLKKEKRREKGLVDKISAAIILQSYMDSKNNFNR